MLGYLTLQEAAQRSGIDPADLELLCRQGQVPGALFGADWRWVIVRGDFEAWLEVQGL